MRAKLELAKQDASQLLAYLQGKSSHAGKNSEHYRSLVQITQEIDAKLARMSAARSNAVIDAELVTVETALVQLTRQPPYTLLMMRVVEIGLPLIACLVSLFFILRYALTETRSREIKDLLERRHAERDGGAAVAVV
jgi:hypothetical protein